METPLIVDYESRVKCKDCGEIIAVEKAVEFINTRSLKRFHKCEPCMSKRFTYAKIVKMVDRQRILRSQKKI